MVETIIFIRHAGNLWNIFNSSLIPPTQLYHAKTLPFVLLQNHEMFSCLKAKTYHKNTIPSACIFMSYSCNLTQIPLLFHLTTEALLPMRSGWLQIFQAGICSAALPSFNSQAGNQVGIISSSTQPTSSCNTLPFYSIKQSSKSIFSVMPHSPQTVVYMVFMIHFCAHTCNDKILISTMASVSKCRLSLLERNLSKSLEEDSSTLKKIHCVQQEKDTAQNHLQLQHRVIPNVLAPHVLVYPSADWPPKFMFFNYCADFTYTFNTTYAK